MFYSEWAYYFIGIYSRWEKRLPCCRKHYPINCGPSTEQLVTDTLLWLVVPWWSQSWLAWDDLHGQLNTRDEAGSWLQTRLQSVRPVSINPSMLWLLIFFNNRNETAPGRRENNGVLTNGTKIELDWPFKSERKWRHRKTDVGQPPCQEANTPWEVSTNRRNRLNHGHLDSAVLLAIFWQKSTFSRTSNRMRVLKGTINTYRRSILET